jgi:hypothetical protein
MLASAKKTYLPPTTSLCWNLTGGDSMLDIQTALLKRIPSIVPGDMPAMSDDECLIRLAQAVEEHDSADLDEVAKLIGRLAAIIE